MIIRPGQKVFTVPGPDWGVRVTQSAAALAYYEKVLSYGPLVYFPMWEPAGVVSEELVNTWNGAYTGVDLGQPGIGDGNTCPWFDGANDFNDIWTAALAAAFNGDEGTAMWWVRVNSAATWTDGAWRCIMRVDADAANYFTMAKSTVNDTVLFRRRAGGANRNITSLTYGGRTDWIHFVFTWSTSANQIILYGDGAQDGVPVVGLNAFGAALVTAYIGSTPPPPTILWHGWIAHVALWTRALTPPEIADLAIV